MKIPRSDAITVNYSIQDILQLWRDTQYTPYRFPSRLDQYRTEWVKNINLESIKGYFDVIASLFRGILSDNWTLSTSFLVGHVYRDCDEPHFSVFISSAKDSSNPYMVYGFDQISSYIAQNCNVSIEFGAIIWYYVADAMLLNAYILPNIGLNIDPSGSIGVYLLK